MLQFEFTFLLKEKKLHSQNFLFKSTTTRLLTLKLYLLIITVGKFHFNEYPPYM